MLWLGLGMRVSTCRPREKMCRLNRPDPRLWERWISCRVVRMIDSGSYWVVNRLVQRSLMLKRTSREIFR